MPTPATFGLFLTAATLLAITPGPGIFYVLARSLKGGRSEGLASAGGTAIGGLGHVLAAALGLSAILVASATAFTLVKYAGAAYLIFLGVRTLLQREQAHVDAAPLGNSRRAFMQGIVTEALNPKTALFFLAFLPQFINMHGFVLLQFVLLGSISVALNTSVDVIVVLLAGPIGRRLATSARLRRRQQQFSGGAMIALGAYVALSNDAS